MESVLNVFFAVDGGLWLLAVAQGKDGGALPVSRWPLRRHVIALLGDFALATFNAFFLAASRRPPMAICRLDADLVQCLCDIFGGAQGI